VILHDCVLGPGAAVYRAIVDKDTIVGTGAVVGRDGVTGGENRRFPSHLSGGISEVGKRVRLPAGTKIGANCLVGPGVDESGFPAGGELVDGESV
jgi:acetyltransferase-like isoleucine patch superfamily enzyme